MMLQLNKKKQNEFIDLVDDVFGNNNPFNDLKQRTSILRIIYLIITTQKI